MLKHIINLLCLMLLVATSAMASSSTPLEAHENKMKAIADYTRGLNQLGPKASTEQKRQLYEKTVGPAVVESANASSANLSAGEGQVRRNVYRLMVKDFPKKLVPKWILGSASSALLNKDGKEESKKSRESSPPIEEVVVDGSQTPRELEFAGKKKSGAVPSAQPSSQ